MSMKVLFLGEIVGKPGIHVIKTALRPAKKEFGIDLTIANGEGATGGFGIGRAHAMQLHKLGIDVITGGEKIYYKLDMVEHLSQTSQVLRPANYPHGNPGKGLRYLTVGEQKVCVVTMLGTSDFPRTHLANPFILMNTMLEKMQEETRFIFFQFHAATTAERNAMGHHLDGRVTAVIGTHSKVMTSDARILPRGTAIITDNGRCGSILSVGGLEPTIEIKKIITQLPQRSKDCWEGLELQGVVVETNDSGSATSITPIRIPVEPPQDIKA